MCYACAMETRKSDSRGRIGGFLPDADYRIERGDSGDFHAFPLMPSRLYPPDIQDWSEEYLASHGLDADAISINDHSELGYLEFDKTEDGSRRIAVQDGRPEYARTWRDWPDGFDYRGFINSAWDEWARRRLDRASGRGTVSA